MRVVIGSCVIALGLGLVSLAFAQGGKVEQGLKVYETQKCAMCHSVAGKGNKKSPLDGVGKKLTEAQIREWIVDPKAAADKAKSATGKTMKAYASLPAADLDALVAYIASLK